MPTRGRWVSDWHRWASQAAVAWSIFFTVLGVYWALGGRGYPYSPETVSDTFSPLLGRLGTGAAWIVVLMTGLPAAAMGAVMLRGLRGKALRPLLITAGALLTGTLLLLMTGLDLLVKVGYIPSAVLGLITAEKVHAYLKAWTQWMTIYQLLCLSGGFLWLAATVSYGRRSVGACLYCGRRDGPSGWNSPERATRWGRVAVGVAMVTPIFYALTRYAWALGIPLGMTEEYLRHGQGSGTWIAGLSLATFGIVRL